MAFKDRLRELRAAASLTQDQLAAKAGISSGSVKNLEQGIRKPSWDTVQKLSDALGVECTAFRDTGAVPAERPSKPAAEPNPAAKGKRKK